GRMPAHGRSVALRRRRVESASGLGDLPGDGGALDPGRSAAALPANAGSFRGPFVDATCLRQQRCSYYAVSLRNDGGNDLAAFEFAAYTAGGVGRVGSLRRINSGLAGSVFYAQSEAACIPYPTEAF